MSNTDVPLFALSEEHQAIREAVRDLCAAKVAQSPSWNRDSAARAFRARSESHGAPCAA